MQLGHGITSGATLLAQLSSSLPHWNNPLPRHQYTIANTTHKLLWHACTRRHMHASIVLLHAFTRCCGCAMGTITGGPKQAVAHVFMPVMSVGNPSRYIAAKMGVQGCREDGVHEAPDPFTGSTGAPNTALHRSLSCHKTRQIIPIITKRFALQVQPARGLPGQGLQDTGLSAYALAAMHGRTAKRVRL